MKMEMIKIVDCIESRSSGIASDIQVKSFHWYNLLVLLLVTCSVSSCITSKKIKDGRTAYEQKQFAVAIDYLQDEIAGKEGSPEYGELAYLLGESFKNLNNSESSLKWYVEAAKSDYGPEAFWEMAYALKKNERYEDAILTFRRLGKMVNREREIRQEIAKCREAQKWQQVGNEHEYIIEALELNSPQSDYSPAIWQGSNIVFTSDRLQGNEERYGWTGNAFFDLYVSNIEVFDPVPFEGRINTEHNEGTAVFTKDGNTVYFTRCMSETGAGYCKIYVSTLSNGKWSKEEPAFRMKPEVNYRDPALIENDSVLIFVSDDPTGIGGTDLYYSILQENGSWDNPELMPPYLNSTGFERFPTWEASSKTIYYSSDHFTTLGGLDIFKTSLKEDNSWTKPENMLAPFNSSEDDYGLVFVEDSFLPSDLKMKAFFTSTRGIYGSDDIYSVIEEYPDDYTPPQDTVVEVVEVEEVEEDKDFFLSIQVYEELYAIPDNPNSFVVGKKKVTGASLNLSNNVGNNELRQTDQNGMIVIPLDSTLLLNVTAGKRGYLNNKSIFSISEKDLEDKPDRFVFEMEVVIDRIFEDVEIVMENIYYDLDKDNIREDAKPALDQLVKILSENPGINIQLSSHTDCQGDDPYNLDLSERRAASAARYIVEEGKVDAARISSVGYGEERLEITCECTECTQEEHQINRRTTFKILQ